MSFTDDNFLKRQIPMSIRNLADDKSTNVALFGDVQNMDDIERAVRGAYPKGVRSIGKSELVDAVKKHFHCSSKDAHYIIGVARRKKIIDISAGYVTLA